MKYRKKPVTIEAVKFLGFDSGGAAIFDYDSNGQGEPGWCWGNWQNGNISYSDKGGLVIKTLEGDHFASIGDYIIQGIKGEIYPCKPDIFEMTYEKVEE